MLKLGYFSHTNFSPSETFIYDLVKALNQDDNIDLTYITGRTVPLKTDFELKSITTGYSEKNQKTAFRLYKIGQIKGGKGHFLKMNWQKKVAFKSLNQSNLPQFDAAYIDYATSGVLLMDYLEHKKIPFTVHVHGYDITASLNDPAYKQELNKMFLKAAFFIAPSNYMRRRLILLGCDERKIRVVRYGVNHPLITPMAWAQRINQPPSIICLGRLVEKKNPVALLHSFKLVKERIPNVTLSIIGDGPLRKEVENTILQLGLSQSVKMYGVLNRTESFPIMNRHWIYVQHSVTSISGDTEGLPNSPGEAALHELPVVSTVHNGIPENVIDGKTGFLVPEYDYEAMAEKIIYLLQNPEVAEQMGKAGREHILQLCNPQERVKKIKELMMKISQQQK